MSNKLSADVVSWFFSCGNAERQVQGAEANEACEYKNACEYKQNDGNRAANLIGKEKNDNYGSSHHPDDLVC